MIIYLIVFVGDEVNNVVKRYFDTRFGSGAQGFTVRKLHLYPLQQAAGGSAGCDRRLWVRLIDLPPWKNTRTVYTHSARRPSSPRPTALVFFWVM